MKKLMILMLLLAGNALAEPPTVERLQTHKVISWYKYSFPVPMWVRWMTRDKDGVWDVWKERPKLDDLGAYWINTRTAALAPLRLNDRGTLAWFQLETPEDGPWQEQIYFVK